MASRNAAAAAAASAPLPFPATLLTLPDLDRPPAVMEMWELEAVSAALPAKKRRLRETFDRLAACSPTPLPFRWEDLDKYISSLQYSVTLGHRQLRQTGKSIPAAAPASAPPAVSSLPATGDVVGHVRALEKSRPVHGPVPAPAPTLPAVSEPRTVGGEVRKLRGRVNSEPVRESTARSFGPAAGTVSASATTGDDVKKGKKRKASIQPADDLDEATRTQEGQAEMRSRRIHDDAAAMKKKPSPLHDGNGEKLRAVPPVDDDNGLAAPAEANASTGATVQVDAVSKIAAAQPELPGPDTARDATRDTNRVQGAGVRDSTGLQRSRPPRPGPGPAAASAAAIAGRDLEKNKKRKVPTTAEANSQKVQMQMQHAAVGEVERHDAVVAETMPSHNGGGAMVSLCRPGHGSGNGLPVTAAVTATAQVDADPIYKAGGIRHEPPATMLHASNATSEAVSPPEQQQQQCNKPVMVVPKQEAPDVEMEIVMPEETMPQPVLEGDTSMAAQKASPTQLTKFQEADEASAKKSDGVPDATRDASHAIAPPSPASAAGSDGRKVSPVPPTVSARDSAVVRQDFPAAGAARRGLSAANLVRASKRREDIAGPSEAKVPAPPNAGTHVLQQQHMPKQEPTSSTKKDEDFWSSRNHGGGGRPVPEAQAAAAQRSWTWRRPGEGRAGGGLPAATARHQQGDDKKDKLKGKPPMFCNKCGCKGHLAGTCRTAKHLVDLYQKAKAEQICYRCGCKGHWSRVCRTPKHLVDLYQKDRAAKRAAGLLQE